MAKLDYRRPKPPGEHTNLPFKEFKLPLILLIVGFAIITATAFFRISSRSGFGLAWGLLTIALVVETGIGIFAAIVTRSIIHCDLGDEQTAVLKLAGIITFVNACAIFLPTIYAIVPVVFFYAGLMILLFELDRYDAVIFTFVFIVARIVAVIVLAWFLSRNA